MRRKRFGAIAVIMTAVVGFILLLLVLDPLRVIGWGLIPLHNMHAEQFLQAVVRHDFKQASASLAWQESKKSDWIGSMEELREQGFYPVRVERLVVPYDREHMDGRANITFRVNDKEETYNTILTLSAGGVNQACIFSPDTGFTKAWNRINCHD
ncbi:hypothetical protein ACFFK0_09370 [Paenibacillus chartarius]|uniref:DUF4830 domain-containing protein n=1 Tax=Paenibacillus chartarius TaxID=747481 RepID=A0ABV6DJ88_9BACL